MMFKVIDITLDDLFQKFTEYSDKTEKLLYPNGDGFVWFNSRVYGQSLVFIRQYSTLHCYATQDSIQTIKDWFEGLDYTDQTYIQIEEFGNGIRFSVFEDIYGIMEM